MKVQVKLFAGARQQAGADAVEVDLPPEATLAQLRAALAQQHPALAELAAQVPFAVDAEYANDATQITADAEIAVIPPVSGG